LDSGSASKMLFTPGVSADERDAANGAGSRSTAHAPTIAVISSSLTSQ
jgi:hypothetical protein